MTLRSASYLSYPLLSALCFSFIFSLNACSWLGFEDEPASEAPPQVVETSETEPLASQATASPQATPSNTSDLEIIWVVPSEQVDKFILRYGFSAEKLDQETILLPEQLERRADEKHGEIYRALLKALPSDKTIYLDLASEKDGIRSDTTPVFEVRTEP